MLLLSGEEKEVDMEVMAVMEATAEVMEATAEVMEATAEATEAMEERDVKEVDGADSSITNELECARRTKSNILFTKWKQKTAQHGFN
jgi:hypothetical protein